jgi:integrase
LESLSDTGFVTLTSSWQNSTTKPLPISPHIVYEGIVLHDQDQKQKTENAMAMKYQQGTVYLQGKKVKKWYGKYLIYGVDQEGKEVRRHRNVAICPKANTPKWKAEQMLRELILKQCNGTGPTPTLPQDDSVTFGWFVRERYIPMRQGKWSPAYRKTNTYQIEHYLLSQFGDLPLRNLDTFGIQIWLNGLAEKDYSQAVVRQCFSNMRAITHMAKKQKFLIENPGEDVTMPQTKQTEKPVMSREQILALLGAIEDVHDLCLLHIGIFCGPRASEVLGLQWKSWTGETLMPYGTAYDGQFYPGRFKTKLSKAPIPVPELVRPVIEAWRRICCDSSPEALMFPTFGRGKRKGQAVPRSSRNFLEWRIRPIARKLGIPDRLITFQVMRRTLGTDMQKHGTLKDTQSILRHASIQTTGDVYVQRIDQSVIEAVNSRTSSVLENWKAPIEELGLKGRNPRGPEVIRRSSAKSELGESVSD